MNIKNYLYPLILFFCIISTKVQAQDPHLSLWQYAPLYANPAMGSVYNGQFRASVQYRNQWYAVLGNNAFKTLHASFDARLPVFDSDYISLGFNVLSDQAGQARYGQNIYNFTGGYMKILSGNYRGGPTQYLIASGQLGIGQRGIDYGDLQFSEQFNGTTFDPDLSTGENFNTNSRAYADINAGLMWYGVFDDRFSLWVGGSGFHLNQPAINFFDDTTQPLYTRLSFQAGGELPLGNDLSILPSILYMTQGPANEVTLGASIRYAQTQYWDEVALRAGFMQRIVGSTNGGLAADAIAISAGLEYQRLMMMVNYDVNTSSLRRATNNRGAFELSLIYTHPPRSRRESVECPRF